MKQVIRPELFGVNVPADSRRIEFDCKNQVIVENEVPVDFVFIGDSITHMWELKAYFNCPGQMILNRGIGGDSTEYLRKRFMADCVQLKPKHCIIKIGVNDAWALEFDPWLQKAGDSIEQVWNKAVENYQAIIKMAEEHAINLVVCSVLPVNMQFTNHEAERHNYILALNEKLQALCAQHNLIYVDYYHELVQDDAPVVRDGLTFEGLHPNVFGYNLMADKLRATLAQHDIKI